MNQMKKKKKKSLYIYIYIYGGKRVEWDVCDLWGASW